LTAETISSGSSSTSNFAFALRRVRRTLRRKRRGEDAPSCAEGTGRSERGDREVRVVQRREACTVATVGVSMGRCIDAGRDVCRCSCPMVHR
jgi:hypothetical protein